MKRMIRWTLCLMAATALRLTAQDCRSIDGSARQAAAYLRQRPDNQSQACIMDALRKLAGPQHAAEASVVTKYLVYRVSRPNPTAPILTARIPWTGDEYPALDTLCRMGLAASPALIAVLSDPKAGGVAQKNAFLVFVFLHRETPAAAVQKLREAGRAAKDPVVAKLLFERARDVSEENSVRKSQTTGF